MVEPIEYEKVEDSQNNGKKGVEENAEILKARAESDKAKIEKEIAESVKAKALAEQAVAESAIATNAAKLNRTAEQFKDDNIKLDAKIADYDIKIEALKTREDKITESEKDIDGRLEALKSEEAQVRSKMAKDAQQALKREADHTAKLKAEDDKRKNEQKAVVKYLDDMASDIYNMHPSYISNIAKDRIANNLLPLLKVYGISPMFNRENEYVPLIFRTELLDNPNMQLERTPNNNGDVDISKVSTMREKILSAEKICVDFYKWIQKTPAPNTVYINWLYKILKTVTELTGDDAKIKDNESDILEYFTAIDKSMINLASQYDQSNHPNKNPDNSIFNHICVESDKLENLLGIVTTAGN